MIYQIYMKKGFDESLVAEVKRDVAFAFYKSNFNINCHNYYACNSPSDKERRFNNCERDIKENSHIDICVLPSIVPDGACELGVLIRREPKLNSTPRCYCGRYYDWACEYRPEHKYVAGTKMCRFCPYV